jgi:hypothetical protein
MEYKIKHLVHSVSNSVKTIMQSSQSPNSISTTLSKDISALERLVNASIAALRNSSSSTTASNSSKPNHTNYKKIDTSSQLNENNNLSSSSFGQKYVPGAATPSYSPRSSLSYDNRFDQSSYLSSSSQFMPPRP